MQKVQQSNFIAKAQDFNAATFRTHELETKMPLLADENRSLSQQLETVGLKERALLEKLTE